MIGAISVWLVSPHSQADPITIHIYGTQPELHRSDTSRTQSGPDRRQKRNTASSSEG